MGLTNDERASLVMLRMDKAKRFLREAEQMLEMELWDLAANRFYYACFHATQALLICYGLSAHTHAGTLGVFGIHFVKFPITTNHRPFLIKERQLSRI